MNQCGGVTKGGRGGQLPPPPGAVAERAKDMIRLLLTVVRAFMN